MAWPSWQDFTDAVQNPESCFADKELWGAVTTDALGLPKVCSGNFAVVYQMRSPESDKPWAVKCFTKPVPDRHQRYREISAHLERADLPFTVGFTYQEQGIRIKGAWYPIVKMDWVEGLTLNQFVRGNLDRPERIDQLCQMWLKLAKLLRRHQITHGDLQHGNVLLVPSGQENRLSLKLVDYDGMFLPNLAQVPSGELGLPAYQHPQRSREKLYCAELDRFSHLVIFTALRVLQTHGTSLWDRFDNGENLLFTSKDFTAPADSKLLAELWRGNESLRQLAGQLVIAVQGPLRDVPELEAVATEGDVEPLTADQQNLVERLLKPKTAVRAAAAAPAPIGWETPKETPPKVRAPAAAAAPVVWDIQKEPPPRVPDWAVKLSSVAIPWRKVGAALGAIVLVAVLWSRWQSAPSPEPAPKPTQPIVQQPAMEPPRQVAPGQFVFGGQPPPNPPNGGNPVDAAQTPAPPPPPPMPPPKIRPKAPELRWTFDQAGSTECVAFHPDGSLLAAGDSKSVVTLWDLRTGQIRHQFAMNHGKINAIAFSRDGHHFAAASWLREQGSVYRVWDLRNPGTHREFKSSMFMSVGLAFAPDHRTLISGESNRYLNSWDVVKGHLLQTTLMKGAGAFFKIAFSPDASTIVAFGNESVGQWSVDRGDLLQKPPDIIGADYVSLSPDGETVAIDSIGGLRLWNLSTGLSRTVGSSAINPGFDPVFAADGSYTAGVGELRKIRLWNLKTQSLALEFDSEQKFVGPLAFHPEGTFFAVGGGASDRRMCVWDLPELGIQKPEPLQVVAKAGNAPAKQPPQVVAPQPPKPGPIQAPPAVAPPAIVQPPPMPAPKKPPVPRPGDDKAVKLPVLKGKYVGKFKENTNVLVTLEAGKSYLIHQGVSNPYLEASLRLEDQSGKHLMSYYDESPNARLSFTPLTTGVYRIIASVRTMRTFSYELTIEVRAP